ncbi:MAG: isoprenylcysteine carboxylmethyltransferase family protein [Phycisphaerales bacterium]|nr:MAG: isoprenylcysteine carboxylmethyltransferase family protein [Phycisphaerales bacterium]
MAQEPGGGGTGRRVAGPVTAIVFVAVFIGGLYWIGGDLHWLRGLAYAGLLGLTHGLSGLYLWRRNPELIRRRAVAGEGSKTWDKVVMGFFGLAHTGTLIVAALDHRYGWSAMPILLWPVGAALYITFVAILTWSMRVNTHFEKFVRIQSDRSHRVINSGPYRYVRHPGYAATILGFSIATPLLLGSWWSFLPAFLSVAFLLVRTHLEDRTLHKELRGYGEYAGRVRYRLVPGLW